MTGTTFTGFLFAQEASTPSLVQCFEQVDYTHRSSPEGGDIKRVFYVQPFTAAKSLEISLRGGFKPNNSGGMDRIKPHRDPIYQDYFVSEVEIVPFSQEAVTGTRTSGFKYQGTAGDVVVDLNNLRDALDTFPANFDYDATLELNPSEILLGQPSYTTDPYVSKGTSGALVTAIYKPLIFANNLSTNDDPFDYVNQTTTVYTKSEAIGKSLKVVYTDSLGTAGYGGVSDAAVYSEAMQKISITRLMLPYNPKNHIAQLMNRINGVTLAIGDFDFPRGTLRVDSPDLVNQITADGRRYFDLTLNFTARWLYTSCYNNTIHDFNAQFATWNHFFAQPSLGPQNIINRALGQKFAMYEVGWTDTLFEIFGDFRLLYIYDNLIKYDDHIRGVKVVGDIKDLFTCGFWPETIKGYPG